MVVSGSSDPPPSSPNNIVPVWIVHRFPTKYVAKVMCQLFPSEIMYTGTFPPNTCRVTLIELIQNCHLPYPLDDVMELKDIEGYFFSWTKMWIYPPEDDYVENEEEEEEEDI